MVTARDAVEARIEGLDCGADDYLVKPFDFGELLARLRALDPPRPAAAAARTARRRRAGDRHAQPSRVGPRTARSADRARSTRCSNISPAAPAMSSAARDIAEHVWDEHYDPLSNVVDVYVQRLRRKLDRPGAESLIRTRRGEGYQLVVDGGR